MDDHLEYVPIAKIVVGENRRAVDAVRVQTIAESIAAIGLQHPLSVRKVGDEYHLVAGLHRLRACESLAQLNVRCTVVEMDDIDSRRWELSENLDRSDLSVLDRGIQLAELVKLNEKKLAQVEQVSIGGRGNTGGEAAACREMGIDRQTARRAKAIAGISPDAIKAVKELGLEDDQSKLIEIAREKPEDQVAKVEQLSRTKTQKPKKGKRVAGSTTNKKGESKRKIWPPARDAIITIANLPADSQFFEAICANDEARLIGQYALTAFNRLQQLLEHLTGQEQRTADSASAEGGDR
jgi:ParB family chromosome partitioning protein